MLLEITTGQIIWSCGVILLIVGIIVYIKLYDRNWSWNNSFNRETMFLVMLFVFLGLITMFIGLNYDYQWIQIEVIK